MKTKGISFWEQHVEHLVLGVAALVALGLIAMQFLGEPNAVTVGTTTVTPGSVNQVLQQKAEEIDAQSRSANVNVDAVVKPVSETLRAQIEAPVNPPSIVAFANPRLSMGKEGPSTGDKPFHVGAPAAPTDVLARQYFDTLASEAVDQTPELKGIFPAAPYDATWNTIYGRFAIADMLKQFSDGGPNGEAAMPRVWFNDRVDFIDVRVEREEYVNGQWVNPVVVDPMLGRMSFRVELKDRKVDDALRQSIVSRAAEPTVRQQVIQPPFYQTVNQVWTPPTADGVEVQPVAAVAAANLTPEELELADLQRRRAELRKRLDNVIKQLQDNGCPDTPPAPDKPGKEPVQPKPKSGGGGGAAAPGGGVGEGTGTALGRGNGSQQNSVQCKSLWKQRTTFEKRLAQADAEIEKLQGQKPAVVEKPADEVVEDKPEDVINVWAHDLSVTPGKTYRYRMTVEVYNPLFGRKPALMREQQPLAEQFVLTSPPSEWTQPITVEPPLRVFVTNAQPANPGALGNIGVGNAQAEVYRFHNGRWWLERFRVQPGDRVGEAKAAKGGNEVDYSTDWFVLDVVEGLTTDDQDIKRGFGATVVLQSLSSPEVTASRSPRDDFSDLERRRLLDEVKLSELGDEEAVASSSG
jgi:hypothetical protein